MVAREVTLYSVPQTQEDSADAALPLTNRPFSTPTDARSSLPTRTGTLEGHGGTESRGHDVPRLSTQQQVRVKHVLHRPTPDGFSVR